MMMGWYNGADMSAGGWIAIILMMSLFWGLVIGAGVMIFRGGLNVRTPAERASHRDPTDILDERFTRGELDRDEYEDRTAVLRASKR